MKIRKGLSGLWRGAVLFLFVIGAFPFQRARAQSDVFVYEEDFSTYNALAAHQEVDWNIWKRELSLAMTDVVEEEILAAVLDPEGNAVVAWGGRSQIALQKLDRYNRPLWESELALDALLPGTLITTELFGAKLVQLALDGQGSAYVLYPSERDGSVGIYLFKIGPDGRPAWDSDLWVAPALGDAYSPAVGGTFSLAVAPDGYVTVGWLSQNSAWPDEETYRLSLHRVSPEGNSAGGTGARAAPGAVGTGEAVVNRLGIAMAAASNGDVLVVTGQQAQWYSPEGQPLWPQPVPFGEGTSARLGPWGAAAGPGGQAWVAWRGRRDGQDVILAQRLEPGGRPAWSSDVVLDELDCTAFDCGEPAVALLDSGELAVWWHTAGFQQGQFSLQRLSPVGELLFPEKITLESRPDRLAIDRQGGVLAFDYPHQPASLALGAARYDAALNPLVFPAVKLSRPSGLASATAPDLAAGPDGQVFAAWSDTRGLNGDPFFQWFDAQGQRLLPADGPLPAARASRQQPPPRVARDPGGNMTVAWIGEVDGQDNVMLQRLDPSGQPLWSAPVTVSGAPPGLRIFSAAVAVEPGGNAAVAWEVGENQGERVYVQQVTPGGEVAWGSPVEVSDPAPPTPQRNTLPALAALPDGDFMVFWNREVPSDYGDYTIETVRAQRLDPQGQPQWSPELDLSGETLDPLNNLSVAADEQGNVLAVWRQEMYGILMQKVSPEGERLWPRRTSPCTMETGCIAEGDPDVAVDAAGSGYVAWDDQQAVQVLKVNPEGRPAWSEPASIDPGPGDLLGMETLTHDASGDLYLGWVSRPAPFQAAVRLARLDPEGRPLWPGPLDAASPGPFYLPAGLAESRPVNPPGAVVSSVFLEAEVLLNGGAAEFFLSNDGGETWEPAALGEEHAFQQPGSDLRWRVVLTPSPDLRASPVVRGVRLTYAAQFEETLFYLPVVIYP